MELVEFDVGLMLAEQQKNAPDNFPYMYEMPRELARFDLTVHFPLRTPLPIHYHRQQLYDWKALWI